MCSVFRLVPLRFQRIAAVLRLVPYSAFPFQGLDYLHASPIGYHASLTPSQCLIDSHWILKISGFGLFRSLVKWRNSGSITNQDNTTLIPNSGNR